MRWWTSDLHLGHSNIIGYTGRPFATVEEMNEALVGQWNERVGPDDETWVLGDFAMGRLAETLPLAELLHGHKTLVPGNHDRPWSGHSKGVDRWRSTYLEAGFDEIVAGPITTTIGSVEVLVDHFPYRGDSRDEDRYVERRPVDRGGWLLHGHVHERWRQNGRQINVGVDAWAGRPVSDDEVAALLSAGPGDLPPRPWPG
ncbi:MAG: metallophosphoesterase [Actinomycetota bacterium]|nr:metallophosphoesterase [Actinomycetota bacterium]